MQVPFKTNSTVIVHHKNNNVQPVDKHIMEKLTIYIFYTCIYNIKVV